MKKVYTLKIDDFSDDDYTLIGIHTSIEDCQMAFLLNRNLQISFTKRAKGISIFQNDVDGEHSVYEYKDEEHENNWYLISNICNIEQKSEGLFSKSEVRTYLIPEKKNVDFFIKIESNFEEDVVRKINAIPQVITSYLIEPELLKSKDNLIF